MHSDTKAFQAIQKTAICARDLHATLGSGAARRAVLDVAALDIAPGRWTCIVGPNGAGKSTLLKALAGLLPCDGHLAWNDIPLQNIPVRARGQKLAWLGQGDGLALDLTVYDTVMLGRLPHQGWLETPSANDIRAVETALRTVQAWDWCPRTLGQLSAGERQRVLLARALAVQAPLMLMDEPLTNLDPPHQADWLEWVRASVQSGTTVLSVLHEITLALHADAIVVLDGGTLRHHGDSADPDTHRAMEAVFGRRLAIHRVHTETAGSQWVALPVLASEAQP